MSRRQIRLEENCVAQQGGPLKGLGMTLLKDKPTIAMAVDTTPTQIQECQQLYAINSMLASKGLPPYPVPPQCGGGGGGGGGGGYQERVMRYGPGQYHAEGLYHSGQQGTEVSVGGRGIEDLYSRFAARSLEERVAQLQDQGLVAEGQAVDDLTSSPALPYTKDQSIETDSAGLDTQSAVFGAENLGPRLMGFKDSQPWLGLLGLGIVAVVLLRGKA